MLILLRLHDGGSGPGVHTGSADVAGDDTHGDVQLLAQHTTHVVADGGEVFQILLGGHLPGSVVIPHVHILVGAVSLGEHTHTGVADAGDVGGLLHTELHIGLTAGQIHVTHQHVGEGDGLVADGDRQVVGAAGLHGRQIGHKVAVGFKGNFGAVDGGGTVAVTLAEEGNGGTAL